MVTESFITAQIKVNGSSIDNVTGFRLKKIMTDNKICKERDGKKEKERVSEKER